MDTLKLDNISTIINSLHTGDIVLFGDPTYWFSRIIMCCTDSPWSHVGIVLRDPVYIDPKLTGVYLWESGVEDLPDAADSKKKWGIQLVELEKKIREYDGIVSVRKLINLNNIPCCTPERNTKLQVIYNTTYNKPYDYNPLNMIFCLLNMSKMNTRNLNRMFCSAFSSYIYTELGYIDPKTNWSMIEPCQFSSKCSPTLTGNDWQLIGQNGELCFINGYTLDPEIKIK